MISKAEFQYLHAIATKSFNNGCFVSVGLIGKDETFKLAEISKEVGNKTHVIDSGNLQRSSSDDKKKESISHNHFEVTKRNELDAHIEYHETELSFEVNYTSQKIDFLLINLDTESHQIEQSEHIIEHWKKKLNHLSVIAIIGANDFDSVDRAIDKTLYSDSSFIPIAGARRIRSFMRKIDNKEIILCGGMQSGGTTLVSWCFLQRPDTTGILDLFSSGLNLMPYVNTEYGWCKMTISSFTWQDVAGYYIDQGWSVKPLLVIRDVRAIYSSLRTKPYGRNGTTAADPPLRVRFRRFLHDWQVFSENDWSIIRFETLISDPEKVLRNTCNKLGLPWNPDMLSWPKESSEISGVQFSNETFKSSLNNSGFKGCVDPNILSLPLQGFSCRDLKWLEDTFSEYNEVNNYPQHLDLKDASSTPDRPNYFSTQHYDSMLEKNKLLKDKNQLQVNNDHLKNKLKGVENEIDRLKNTYSWRITAPLRKIYNFFYN